MRHKAASNNAETSIGKKIQAKRNGTEGIQAKINVKQYYITEILQIQNSQKECGPLNQGKVKHKFQWCRTNILLRAQVRQMWLNAI